VAALGKENIVRIIGKQFGLTGHWNQMRRVCRIDLRSDIDLVHNPCDIERIPLHYLLASYRRARARLASAAVKPSSRQACQAVDIGIVERTACVFGALGFGIQHAS
jgi:hypothetical protein